MIPRDLLPFVLVCLVCVVAFLSFLGAIAFIGFPIGLGAWFIYAQWLEEQQ